MLKILWGRVVMERKPHVPFESIIVYFKNNYLNGYVFKRKIEKVKI